nr:MULTISPECIES: hypothetical protein [unclassified Microcoleus]
MTEEYTSKTCSKCGHKFKWRFQYPVESFERYLLDRRACSFFCIAIHGSIRLSPGFAGLNVSVESPHHNIKFGVAVFHREEIKIG